MRSSKAELSAVMDLFLKNRMPDREKMRAAAEAQESAPASVEAARLQSNAEAMVTRAAKVHAAQQEGKRISNLVPFADFAAPLVPKPPASFLGKLKLSSLTGFAAVEKALRERGIGGWVPHTQKRRAGDPPRPTLPELKALLPTEIETEKTGRRNETVDVEYVTGDIIAEPVADEVEQEAFAALAPETAAVAAGAAFLPGQAPAQASTGPAGRPRRAGAGKRKPGAR